MESAFLGCIEGDIRLADGFSELEGRVEICRQNEWGTVCHSHWDKADATVVCRQLGLSIAGTYGHSYNVMDSEAFTPIDFIINN